MILKTKLEIIAEKLAELSEAIVKDLERCKEEMRKQFIEQAETELEDVQPPKKRR